MATGLAQIDGYSDFHIDPAESVSLGISAKGSLDVGMYGKVSLNLIHKGVVHASGSFKAGLKLAGEIGYTWDSETWHEEDFTELTDPFYDGVKNTKIKLEAFANLGLELGVTPWSFLTVGAEYELGKADLGSCYLFPHFTQPALPTYDSQKDQWSNGNFNSHVALLSEPSKNIPDFLLGPCKIGLKIIDEDGVCVRETEEREYRDEGTIYWIFPLSIDLTGLTPGKTYRCFPVLRYHEWQQLRATPSYEFTVPEPMTLNLDTPLNSVTLKKGQEQYVAINGGWGDYSAISSIEGLCSAEIIKNNDQPYVKISASKQMEGSAVVTVKDLRAGTTETILITVSGEFTPVTRIVLAPNELTMEYGESKTLLATVLPLSADNKDVLWSSSDSEVAVVSGEGRNATVTAVGRGSCTITCSATDGSGVYAECPVTVTSGTTPDPGNHEWVDLGLPSGTKWATGNVGANSPEEYGDYFAWGETEPKTTYNWSTYKYCNESNTTMTKYCIHSSYGYNGFTDGKTELEPEDDAATANWGSGWQMPSYDQIKELYNSDYTTTEWTQLNGINGRKITSKSNGNSIFLPATGYLSSESVRIGSYGYYWSRSLNTNHSDYACDIRFYSGIIDTSDDGSRYYGQGVRPVRKQ